MRALDALEADIDKLNAVAGERMEVLTAPAIALAGYIVYAIGMVAKAGVEEAYKWLINKAGSKMGEEFVKKLKKLPGIMNILKAAKEQPANLQRMLALKEQVLGGVYPLAALQEMAEPDNWPTSGDDAKPDAKAWLAAVDEAVMIHTKDGVPVSILNQFGRTIGDYNNDYDAALEAFKEATKSFDSPEVLQQEWQKAVNDITEEYGLSSVKDDIISAETFTF